MESYPRNAHLRILGSNPVFDVQASSLGVVLGSNTAADANVRFDLWNGDMGDDGRFLSLSHHSESHKILISSVDDKGPLYLGENDVASMRVGSNQVRIDTDTWLQSNLVLNRGDIVVVDGGTIHATKYDNLIDDFSTQSLTMPPTANALAQAYITLSNLIISRSLAPPPSSSSSPSIPSYGDDIKVGKLACTDVTTGSFLAYTYCNLVVDFRVNSYMDQPVSAYALTSAYTQLSNYVQTELASIGTLLQAGFSPMEAFSGSSSNLLTSDGRWQTDMWLSSSDGRERVYFGSDGVAQTACSRALWRASPEMPVSLELDMSNANVSLSLNGSMDVDTLNVRHGVDFTGVSELHLPTWLSLDVSSIHSATYCNLPVASSSLPGVVTLMHADQWPDMGMSNLVPTGTNLALITSNMDKRLYDITSLYMEALYASHIASNIAGDVLHRYQADTLSLRRDYYSNTMVAGMQLVSHASESNDAGASIEIENNEGSRLVMSLALDNLALLGNDGGPLTLYGGSEISRATSVLTIDGGKVSVVPGEFAPQVIPQAALVSDNDGSGYIVSSSSTYSSDVWAQAFQAFSGDAINGWVSASRYDSVSGAPSTLTSDVTQAPPISVRGEWLQLTLPEGIGFTYLRSFFVQTINANARPDNFVIVVREPGATEWRRVAFYEHQSDFVAEGTWYVLPRSVAISSFRIIITKVAPRSGESLLYPSIAEIDIVRLRMGSMSSSATDALFVVGGAGDGPTGLVVSHEGEVGIRQSSPSAMLHFGNTIDPRMLVLYDRDPTYPNLHEFCGMGMASNGMIVQLDSSNTSLILQAGRGAEVPDEVLLNVSGLDGSIDTQGSLWFNGGLAHRQIGHDEEWTTTTTTTTMFIDSNGTFRAGPLSIVGAHSNDTMRLMSDHAYIEYCDHLSVLSHTSSNTNACSLYMGVDSPVVVSGTVDVNNIVTSCNISHIGAYPATAYSNMVTGLALSNIVGIMCTPQSEGIVHVANMGPLLLNPDGGDVIVNGVPSQTLADASLGKDLVSLQEATATLLKLVPRMYRKVPTPDSESLGVVTSGFIAQEMVEGVPELEHLIHDTVTPSGTMSSINYIGLIAYLVKAIQEHEERILRIEDITY